MLTRPCRFLTQAVAEDRRRAFSEQPHVVRVGARGIDDLVDLPDLGVDDDDRGRVHRRARERIDLADRFSVVVLEALVGARARVVLVRDERAVLAIGDRELRRLGAAGHPSDRRGVLRGREEAPRRDLRGALRADRGQLLAHVLGAREQVVRRGAEAHAVVAAGVVGGQLDVLAVGRVPADELPCVGRRPRVHEGAVEHRRERAIREPRAADGADRLRIL